MRKVLNVKISEPQYVAVTNITFAQVDAWFGHTREDLKLDIIYPEDTKNSYPCIVWICGGAWISMDKSAHLLYLSMLAKAGFVVASVQYRTSNKAKFPAQIQDVKAAIRYLKAHAKRYSINEKLFGVMGESAGGYLAAMVSLAKDKLFDVGQYLEYTSDVQSACVWYPPADITQSSYTSIEEAAASPESLMFGKNVALYKNEALKICPISYITNQAPPFLIIHGTNDKTVPFSQGESLYNSLEQKGNDVTLISIEGAGHADIQFFQDDVWKEIISFFKNKLY